MLVVLVMMSITSPVSFPAPTSPLPEDTMTTRLHCDMGAATSAATLGRVSSIMSRMAASLYSRKASAFLISCSASARALLSIAKASASPFKRSASASASASMMTRFLLASAIFSRRYFSASAGRRMVASSSFSLRRISCSCT
uniref:Secreted protein n=1 Tax=Ixodes ricinus TaxID=34613 RepID=A0A6B0UTG4_IXORI